MRNDIVPPKRPVTSVPPRSSPPPVLPSTESEKPLGDAVTEITTITSTEPQASKPRSHRRLFIILGIVLALFISLGIAFSVWYNVELAAVTPGKNEKVKVTIKPGSSPIDIAATLKKNNLIRSQAAFNLYARLTGKSAHLQSGVYRLSKSEDVPAIIKHLTSGNTDTFSITFLPGATLAENREVLLHAGYTVERVDDALTKQYTGPLFDGKPAGTDLEGYIYGETYQFSAEATPEQILTRAFEQFETVVQKENLVQLFKNQGFNLYQGITLASIIQREVGSPSDSAQVAQVFELRLKKNMALGSDVTYQYIADKTGQPRSVNIDSPYNTRKYPGLPPGPISVPGLAALKAVGSPAPGDYLFFISGDDDKTYFAHTNEEHEKNIKQHCHEKCQIT